MKRILSIIFLLITSNIAMATSLGTLISPINGVATCTSMVEVTEGETDYFGLHRCESNLWWGQTEFFEKDPAANANFQIQEYIGCATQNFAFQTEVDFQYASSPTIVLTGHATYPWMICVPPPTPIVIDMRKDGIEFGYSGVYVWFDYWDEGQPMKTQWVKPGEDDVLLALDLNNNGRIDSGKELFGNTTWLLGEHTWADHGYHALAQYDEPEHGGNGDGIISRKDKIWEGLLLWRDSNADATSSQSELSMIADSRIVGLKLDYKESDYIDPAGNHWAYQSTASSAAGTHLTVDVIFALF